MNQKTESSTWKTLLLTGAFLAALSSCGGGGGSGGGIPDPTPTPTPEPDPDPTPGVTTGEITFTSDWGSLPPHSALRFHFYPITGAMVTKDGNAGGCKATLESGTYKVLAYNTDATGVTFENTDSYDKVIVRVKSVSTRAASTIGQPGNVYALSMEGLNVEKGSTVNPKASVRNLVKPFSLSFSIDKGSAISSIEGYLNGFIPSVSLVTGKSDDASVAQTIGLLFDVNLSGDTGSADLRCLGMLDPQKGSAYSSKLLLNMVLVGGRTVSTEVDLSVAVSDILARNNGVLPDGNPAEIKVKLESQTDIAFTATVTDWSVGDTLDGSIK